MLRICGGWICGEREPDGFGESGGGCSDDTVMRGQQ